MCNLITVNSLIIFHDRDLRLVCFYFFNFIGMKFIKSGSSHFFNPLDTFLIVKSTRIYTMTMLKLSFLNSLSLSLRYFHLILSYCNFFPPFLYAIIGIRWLDHINVHVHRTLSLLLCITVLGHSGKDQLFAHIVCITSYVYAW